MALIPSESNGERELQRLSSHSAVGEIWLAYPHLVSMKHGARGPELFRALDAATGAVLEALWEAEDLKPGSRAAA